MSSSLLYVLSAAPSITELFSDSLEFQLVVPTLGITHPTGYPLYTLLGALWSQVIFPFGNWAWRVNIFSALAGAGTVTLLFCTGTNLFRTADDRPNLPACLITAALFAVGPVWWSQATIAEIYTLHGFFVATILYLITKQKTPSITILSLLIGLALAHHRMTILLLPGLLLYVILSSLRPVILSSLHRTIPALLAPLMLYLLIPLRASMGVHDLNGSYVNNWAGFWDHILARAYTRFLYDNPLAIERTGWDWLLIFEQQLSWLGLLLAVIGLLAWLYPAPSPQLPAPILLMLATNLLFALNYQVSDVEVFLLPTFLFCALLVGAGMNQIMTFQKPSFFLKIRFLYTLLPWLLCIGLTIFVGGRAWPQIREQRLIWNIHDYAVAMAKVDFPPDSRVIGLEGEMTALKYMQQAEGLAQNAVAVVADDPMQRSLLVDQMVAAGYPTYLTRELPGIETSYSFSGHGPLVRVWPRGESEAGTPQSMAHMEMADGRLVLTGYDLMWLEEAGGRALRVVFYWLPVQELNERFKVSLRLLNRQGEPIHWPTGDPVVEDRFLLRQVAHSDQWLVGEVVRDVHRLKVPGDMMEDVIALQAILYHAETGQERGRWGVEIIKPSGGVHRDSE